MGPRFPVPCSRLAALLVALLLAGVGSPASSRAAEPVAGPTAPIKAVSAGDRHTCLIRQDGTLACWGDLPGPLPGGTFTAVTAMAGEYGSGMASTCAIREGTGALVCWGGDHWELPEVAYRRISMSGDYACAVDADDQLRCDVSWWLESDYETEPNDPPAGAFTEVSVEWDSACAIRKTDGSLVCWAAFREYDPVLPSGSFTTVSGRCAIRDDGTLWCWGSGLPMSPAGTFTSLDVGGYWCAVRTSGKVVCWGYSPALSPPPDEFTTVAVGSDHSCGIRTDGTLACWGHEWAGEELITPRPLPWVGDLGHWQAVTTLDVTWGADPVFTPVADFDVRTWSTRWDGRFYGSTRWFTATTATTAPLGVKAGRTYCFQSRARDLDGLASDWSWGECVAIPVDDRSLARAGRWAALTGAAYYRSTALRSSARGATLTLSGVESSGGRGDDLALVATTCPTCGTVKVYRDSRLLDTISLASDSTVNRALLPVANTSWFHGKLTIKVVSSGKKVIIDGVAIYSSWPW